MKKYLSITLLTCLISVTTNCYAQTKIKDTIYLKDINGIVHKAILHTTDDGWYYYETDSPDSSKYFYKKYLALKRKGVPDSENKFYLLLKKLKK